MSTMLITSHPAPVREAIGRHRDALDADPVAYLEENGTRLTEASRAAAASYLGMHPAHVALTDSTTMGVGLIYTGLKVGPGQEVLTTDEDYYVTHESLRHLTDATGATERRISLFDDISEATDGGIVQRIVDAIRPETRLLALTWVHSSTGLKIPVGSIAVALQEINAGRDEQDHVLFGLDAVHGFGVETDSFFDLGVDFLMAGCHKWLFGPRGTGIAAISERGLGAVRPIVPTFDDARVFSRWYAGEDYALSNNGRTLTPGGFKDFEHRWALAEAFALHEEIGRARVAERTHTLAGDLKDALAGIRGVSVVTPRQPGLSAGIVCFDVEGLEPEEVVSRLRSRSVVASVAPYPSAHVRLTPSIRNSEAEIEAAARAVRSII
ncbi:aminotransferase class V-fold PLP-dependent enzyme [Palleronia sp.]|uniref:aminotransferase class V-fold PLP-dependent enzyme n=1 Tax=Palleronia sp. TaxID=1940284 RepID=UPI0035C7C7FE